MDIKEIIELSRIDSTTAINRLKTKNNVCIDRNWDALKLEYFPENHDIMNPAIRKRKKKKGGGSVDVSRISLDVENLIVSRMTEFMFSVPVQRIYHYDNEEDKEFKDIVKAIEAIYNSNRIDNVNLKRAKEYFASCEVCTQWYTVNQEESKYGFDSKTKLKCKSFSPMNGFDLYPLFDSTGDMIAFSMEYRVDDGESIDTYFETYTADEHLVFVNGVYSPDKSGANELKKIPFIYIHRKQPIWNGVQNLVNELEFTLSRNSDVIAYNSAPIIKVVGTLQGDEEKGEERRIFRVENGGDVNYVSWSQSIEAIKFQVDYLLKLIWMQMQLPDISFDNLKGSGQLNASAMRMLLTDSHLKVGDESGEFGEFFDREFNVVKAYLATMNPKWSKMLKKITVENIISPFTLDDLSEKVNIAIKANGGNAILSQKESIDMAGLSNDTDRTLSLIQQEEKERNESKVSNLFEGAI